MAIYLRPWFRNHIKYLAWVTLFVIIAGSPAVSETPKLHKPLLRGRAVVARKAHFDWIKPG